MNKTKEDTCLHVFLVDDNFIATGPERPYIKTFLRTDLDTSVFRNLSIATDKEIAFFVSDKPHMKDCVVVKIVRLSEIKRPLVYPLSITIEHWNIHPMRISFTKTHETKYIAQEATDNKLSIYLNECIASTFKSLERLVET